MSNKSNRNGRAFEYSILLSLSKILLKNHIIEIVKNKELINAKTNFESLFENEKNTYNLLSDRAVSLLIKNTKSIINNTKTKKLILQFQSDLAGKIGDVRDIIIRSGDNKQEIGINIKYNNDSIKHSRLSLNSDFCLAWFNIKCSQEYLSKIDPIFKTINKYKDRKNKWSELEFKFEEIYRPLLTEFRDEIIRQYSTHGEIILEKLIKYLIGQNDYFKIVIKNNRSIKIQKFNIFGKNKDIFPNRIKSFDFVKNSSSTLELLLNNNWSFRFRIHSASTYVENSLKLDITITDTPISLKENEINEI